MANANISRVEVGDIADEAQDFNVLDDILNVRAARGTYEKGRL